MVNKNFNERRIIKTLVLVISCLFLGTKNLEASFLSKLSKGLIKTSRAALRLGVSPACKTTTVYSRSFAKLPKNKDFCLKTERSIVFPQGLFHPKKLSAAFEEDFLNITNP